MKDPSRVPLCNTLKTSALNVKNSVVVTGKGVLNNRISEYLMTRLGEMGIPTHFVRRLNMREQLVREVEMIPLEVVVRNFAAGSFAEIFRMSEGTPLPRSIVEYYYKSEELSEPMVSEEHITAFGWATLQDLDEVMALSLRINDFLSGLFLGIGMRLMDLSVELAGSGRTIRSVSSSPTRSARICRLWDIRTNKRLDRERFRGDFSQLADAYQEVARRLGILPESGPADMKGPEVMQ